MNNKTYTFYELMNMYGLLNIEFKYFGNNDKGDLLLYMLNDNGKVSVFKSSNTNKTKYDYFKLTDEQIEKIKFTFDKEEEMKDYDINVLVNSSSRSGIPSGRYSIESLNELTLEEDKDLNKDLTPDEVDGIAYIVVDRNSNTTLFSGLYEFGKGGFLFDIENNLLPDYEKAKNRICVENIKWILKNFRERNSELENSL